MTDNRHIDTDHIADIHYKEASSPRIDFGAGPIDLPQLSSLTITLNTGEEIDLQGEEADTAWSNYNSARKAD